MIPDTDSLEPIIDLIFLPNNLEGDQCSALKELTSEQNDQAEKFLELYAPTPAKLGRTHLKEHTIDVEGHQPIRSKSTRRSPAIMDEMYKLTDKFIAHDIIEPSKSGWNSRIVMVRKPNGTYRLCIDYRDVNKISKKDAYPLPPMSNILDKLQRANYMSTIDLDQAFHQIPIERQSREVTAFSVPVRGHFQYKTMPFGLIGAPASFQRLIDKIIGLDIEPYVLAYLDNIVVVTETLEDHLKWLKETLRRIKDAGLTFNPEKCSFFRNEIKYLGFVVNNQGVKIDLEKLAPILGYEPPQNIRQLRRFLGFASWYRRFLPNLATVAELLTRLLKSKQS